MIISSGFSQAAEVIAVHAIITFGIQMENGED